MVQDDDTTADDTESAEAEVAEAKPAKPQPAKAAPRKERWVPTLAYPLEIDLDTVTLNEQLTIGELADASYDELFSNTPNFRKVARALVCVMVRRRTPDFTLEEAGDLQPKAYGFKMVDDVDGKPMLPLASLTSVSPNSALVSSLTAFLETNAEGETDGSISSGSE